MKIETLKFGLVEVDDAQVYIFPDGLIGFPSMTKFVFINDERWAPFTYMQSLDLSSLSFVVSGVETFFPDYSVTIPESDIESLELRENEPPRIMSILTVYKDIENTTANLKGPIIVNDRLKTAKQVVIVNCRYTTKEKIFNFKEAEKC